MSKRAPFGALIGAALTFGFLSGYFLAAPLRGGLVAALQAIFATPVAAAALIASGVALIVGLMGPFLSYAVNSKQVAIAILSAEAAKISANAAMMNANYAGTRALANVRLEWLNDLRDTLSKFHSILMEPKNSASDDRQLSYLGTKLDLLLNQQKKYQRALWQVSDNILNLKNPTDDDYDAADKLLVEAARVVLDFHWRKIKAEMLGDTPLKEPSVQEPPAQGSKA